MKSITAMIIVLVVVFISYSVNLYKFIGCDFNAPYKGEVFHAIGVFVPPLSVATAWVDEK